MAEIIFIRNNSIKDSLIKRARTCHHGAWVTLVQSDQVGKAPGTGKLIRRYKYQARKQGQAGWKLVSESMSINEGCCKKGGHSARQFWKELITTLGRTVMSLDLNQPAGLECRGRIHATGVINA